PRACQEKSWHAIGGAWRRAPQAPRACQEKSWHAIGGAWRRAPQAQATRQAPSESRFLIAVSRSPAARVQNAEGARLYSMSNTALPAFTKGTSLSHSSYWKHCSATEKSNDGRRSATWSGSFFSPIARPRLW